MRLAERHPTAPTHSAETHPDALRAALDDPLLSLSVTQPALGVRVVHAVGEIDLNTRERVRTWLLEQLCTAPPHTLVIDFSGISFLAVCGLSLLDELDQTARHYGTQVRLVATTRAVTRLLEFSALDERIPTHASIQDALDSCRDTAPHQTRN